MLEATLTNLSPVQPTLPLAHTTDAFLFRTIRGQDQLAPQLCTVFKEKLLYAFYGQPNYSTASRQTMNPIHHPIALLLRPDTLTLARDAYPFDSGAFEAGRFEGFFHKKMPLSDFRLTPGNHSPERLITRFFGTNDNYYHGVSLTISDGDEYEITLSQLYSPHGAPSFDNRCSTIELTFSIELPISQYVFAVAIPGISSFQETDVREWANIHSIELIPYYSERLFDPYSDVQAMKGAVHDYYQRNGYL